MKFLIIISIILMSVACKSTPVEAEAFRISNKTYTLDVYDCSNKSAEFLSWLHANGHTNSRIYVYNTGKKRHRVTEVNGVKVTTTGDIYHAVVELDGMIYDVTSGRTYDRLARIKALDGTYAIDYPLIKAYRALGHSDWGFEEIIANKNKKQIGEGN